MNDRLRQIVRCVEEIHRCESELPSDKTGTGAWLGYMDWLEELHYAIWELGSYRSRSTIPGAIYLSVQVRRQALRGHEDT